MIASGRAPVNGISMYYERYGEGDIPLVLIHGGGSTIESTFGVLLPMPGAHLVILAGVHGTCLAAVECGPGRDGRAATTVALLEEFLKK